MLKIGVFGVGHLGKIHVKLLQNIEHYELVGFYDPNNFNAEKVSQELGVKRFTDFDELIAAIDVADIVTPTSTHFEVASRAIEARKHIFIEKPLASNMAEARQLVDKVAAKGVKAQVGHVERFNPAFLAVKNIELQPMFIETHRLAMFNPRGTDVSVVLDLMIHDIDVILSIVPSKVKAIHASGVSIVSTTPDIANARIEFENGCVANVTASRLSLKNMRKTRIFQPNAYVSIDFLEKKSEIVRISEAAEKGIGSFEINMGDERGKKYILFEKSDAPPVNSIQMELSLFAESILQNKREEVTIEDGYNAMEIAYRISDAIEERIAEL
ncbi:MAG: Gfo/Idh/MocA family oxidoreductase [Chitinophagales bacterium]